MNDTDTIPSPALTDGAGDPFIEAAALAPWFQNLHLPDGTQTAPDHPLGDHPQASWEQFRDFLPDDLTGCTVLDIGCNAGFFSIELARRGAEVTALDCNPHVLRQAQWAIGRHGLQERITLYHGRVYDLARWKNKYDVVLFLDLFEQLRYPLLALDLAARLVRRCLVLQGRTMPGDEIEITPDDLPADARDALTRPGWPKMAFIEKSVAGESANWWAPNRACLEAMLRSTGLEIVARPGDDIYLCQTRSATNADESASEAEFSAATGTAAGELTRFGDPQLSPRDATDVGIDAPVVPAA